MGNHWACGSNVMWLQMKVLRICQCSPFTKNPEYYDFSKIKFVLDMLKPMQCNDEDDEKEKLLAARMGRKRPF